MYKLPIAYLAPIPQWYELTVGECLWESSAQSLREEERLEGSHEAQHGHTRLNKGRDNTLFSVNRRKK